MPGPGKLNGPGIAPAIKVLCIQCFLPLPSGTPNISPRPTDHWSLF
jgi:hypothetical protein